ncbi:MAG: M17 family peptidase N-terminal domain-containing protein, partial [Notoacmeibacter sp.]
MSRPIVFSLAKPSIPKSGTLVVLVGEDLALPAGIQSPSLSKAITSRKFSGKSGTLLDVLAPEAMDAERVILLGCGAAEKRDYLAMGGKIMAAVGSDAAALVLAQT